jgi:DNA-binding PadR family transcriptional regulator
MKPISPRGPMPGRVLSLYALATLDREGRLHGYELAERIASRTDGTWRPGPGAIYPALGGLSERGLARSKLEGRRRVYHITPEGRAFLRRLRAGMLWRARGGPDLGALWSEIAGHADPGRFRFERLRHETERMTDYLSRAGSGTADLRLLRKEVRDLLARAERQLAQEDAAPPRPRGRRRPT